MLQIYLLHRPEIQILTIMVSFRSKLGLGRSLNKSSDPIQSNVTEFSFQKSKSDKSMVMIQPTGGPMYGTASYTAKVSKCSKPHVTLFKDGNSSFVVGNASLHAVSFNTDLSIHGQPMAMKVNQWSGSSTIRHPTLGNLKWKSNSMSGASWELLDSTGVKLGQFKTSSMNLEAKKLELFVPCQDDLLDLIVLSAMAVNEVYRATIQSVNVAAAIS
jgi:hypothetical protein